MKNSLIILALFTMLTACSNEKIDFEESLVLDNEVEIVVDFDDDLSFDEIQKIEKDTGVEFKQNSPLFSKTKITIATVRENQLDNVEEALKDYDSVIESASVNSIYSIDPLAYHKVNGHEDFRGRKHVPNDPMFDQQWNLRMVDSPEAWDTATGKDVVVAVIDTGISNGSGKYGRVPDLGSTCFVDGFNFVDNDDDPYDYHSHGTHVGGTIAQSTNNGIGVAGVAYNSCLMPIKVLSDEGYGTVADIAEGIRWATDNGAKVINMSLGGGAYSAVMESAVRYAYENGVFLACAAGNGSRATIEFPAGYEGCHAVSAVDSSGEMAWYSSHGESKLGTKLFIAAPGGDTRGGPEGGVLQDTIVSGDPTKHGYYAFQGTSMATPHVAGVAALVFEMCPDCTPDDVAGVLANSATDKDDFSKYGHGVLNAKVATEYALDKKEDDDGTSLASYILMFLISLGVATLSKLND